MERDKIIEIIAKQRDALSDVDKVIHALKSDEILKENKDLKEKLEELNKKIEDTHIELKKVKEDKNKLTEKMFSIFYEQKEKDIKHSINSLNKKKSEYLFEYERAINDFERKFNESLKENISLINIKDDLRADELKEKLDLLNIDINEFIIKKREEERILIEQAEKELKLYEQNLIKTPISEEEANEKLKTLNFELKLGGKFTSIIGIILIMLSITYGAYLTYNLFGRYISQSMKLALIYLFGIGLIALSEFFRKKAITSKTFYTVILGGGVGVLYLGTTIGYFIFDGVLSSTATLVIVAIISISTFLLAIKNDVEVISMLALIGGYMPLIDFAISEKYITGMVLYILALNSLALFTSIKRDWKITKYFSLVLNFLTTTSFILLIIDNRYWNFEMTLIYSLLILFMTIAIIIYYPIKNNIEIKVFEKIALIFNILLNLCVVIYLSTTYIDKYSGYFILILAIIYFVLAKLLEKKASSQKDIISLFYIVAVTISFIAVLLQFDLDEATILLIAEGALLVIYGKHIKNLVFEYLGKLDIAIISIFLMVEFNYPKTAILILANLMILFYIYFIDFGKRYELKENKLLGLYKIYILAFVYQFIGTYMYKLQDIYYRYEKFQICIFIVIVCLINILLYFIKFLKDKILNIFMLSFSGIIFMLIIMNGVINSRSINLFTGLVVNILFLISTFTIIKDFTTSKAFIYIFNGFLSIILLIQALIAFGNYSYNSYYLSLFCLILALIYIILGFRLNIASLRSYMLGTVYVFLSKIFIIDFKVNSQFERVIVLFIFGVILILISYLYQKFAKKLFDSTEERED